MQVSIKDFAVQLDIGSKGIELDVSDTDGEHLGDLIVTMTGLTWCNGKKSKQKGKKTTWEEFIKSMQTPKEQAKAAAKAEAKAAEKAQAKAAEKAKAKAAEKAKAKAAAKPKAKTAAKPKAKTTAKPKAKTAAKP